MTQAVFTSVQAIDDRRAAAGLRYFEFVRVQDLSAGLYVLEAGAVDPQDPHSEDELYVVMRGHCRFRAGAEEQEVGPGAVLFVPAQVEHRFLEIRERLEALVFFGPAERIRS